MHKHTKYTLYFLYSLVHSSLNDFAYLIDTMYHTMQTLYINTVCLTHTEFKGTSTI